MSSLEHIGQKLKAAREGRGLTLGQIYDKTKIPTSNLEAIEAADYEQLPEPVYVAGFIKRYADCVGLNGQSLSDEYKQCIEEANNNGRSIFSNLTQRSRNVAVQPQPIVSTHVSKAAFEPPRPSILKSVFWPAVLIIMVLIGMGYVVMLQNQRYLAQNDPSLIALRESASRFNSVQPSNQPLPGTTGTTAANSGNKNPEPVVNTNDKDCRISLSASQHVWVEVKSVTSGESKFTGFLEAGERRDFQDDAGLKVRAGNGASLSVAYHGKSETFGPAGQRVDREFLAANPQSSASAASAATTAAGTTDGATAVKATVKRPKKTGDTLKKTRPQVHQRSLDDAPSRYIPGESLGGSRSIGVPYRYTDGRLDSD